MVLTVHHLNHSRSQRILWLLEELGVPYEIVKWQRNPDDFAPKELGDVHPLGLAPIIVDGDITIAESGAIVQYLLRKYGKQRETLSESARINDIYFTHYAEGSLMPILISKVICRMVPERAPLLLKPFLWSVFDAVSRRMVAPRLETHREYIEMRLSESDGEFFAGGSEPTAADFMMIFPLELWAKKFPECFGPKCREYVERIHERPAFKRSIEKGGEYGLL
ncbi:thioredoxin-like protein [Thelephora ganbajun]|uniref:Thioredoxin-like protein n=1 Tax=Thelephora ganbajun TaxID=370292 RepID=A0ACB6ZSK4_THEGA|nr:thioredoxin-like protein [Thelephora ganbajun]